MLLTAAALAAAVPAWAGGPLASGSTVAGSVSGPTFRETWTFSGTAGDRVLFAAVTTSGLVNTSMRLLLPGGGTGFQTSGDRVDYALPFTGSYTLEVEDSGLNGAGGYALGFLNVTAGPLASGADPDGGVRYRPASDELRMYGDMLALAYKARPVTLIRMIYALRDARIQTFADAFKLRKS